jgi:hypothetical protein
MRFRTHANLTQNPTVALILATVHHRLRLLAFPMRTASGCRTTMNLPRFWAYYLFRSLPRGKPQRCPEPSTSNVFARASKALARCDFGPTQILLKIPQSR